jgi:hypothetical protein
VDKANFPGLVPKTVSRDRSASVRAAGARKTRLLPGRGHRCPSENAASFTRFRHIARCLPMENGAFLAYRIEFG